MCKLTKFFMIIFVGMLASTSLQAKEPALTAGFDHIGLTVSNLEASTDFFVNTLGWKNAGGDDSYPVVYVTDGDMFLSLWQSTNGKDATPFNRKENVGLHHLAIKVSSFEILEEIHQRIKKVKGAVVEFAPEIAFGGPGKHMMVREPSGNRLEFIHRPKT